MGFDVGAFVWYRILTTYFVWDAKHFVSHTKYLYTKQNILSHTKYLYTKYFVCHRRLNIQNVCLSYMYFLYTKYLYTKYICIQNILYAIGDWIYDKHTFLKKKCVFIIYAYFVWHRRLQFVLLWNRNLNFFFILFDIHTQQKLKFYCVWHRKLNTGSWRLY